MAIVVRLGVTLYLFDTAVIAEETTLYVPFFKDVAWAMGWLFVPFSYFVIVGSSNAVNLTDGLDGLAIMPTVMVASGLGVIAYLAVTSSSRNTSTLPTCPGPEN